MYNEIQQKHNLPKWKTLQQWFAVEEKDLAAVKKTIAETYESYAKLLESMVQPNSHFSDIYESHYVNDNDRDKAYQCYKKIMHVLRFAAHTSIKNNEKDHAAFIRTAFDTWKEIHTDLKGVTNTLSDIWLMETNIKEDRSYFG